MDISRLKMEVLDTLPILDIFSLEIIERILGLCDSIEDILRFGKTSKVAKAMVLHFFQGEEAASFMASRYMPNYKRGKVNTLYKEQIKGLLSLRAYPDKNLFIRSPLGTGKTFLALMHAEDCWKREGIRTIIVATPKCFTSWMDHLKLCNYNVVKCRPEKSDVLVFHSKCKKHREFILNSSNEDLSKLPYYIILTTTYYISDSRRAQNSRQRLSSLGTLYTQTITDESHLLKRDTVGIFRSFKRNIYLSASPMEQRVQLWRHNHYKMYDKRINLESTTENTLKRDHVGGAPVKMEYQLLTSTGTILSQIVHLINDDFKGKKVVLFTHWNPRNMTSNVDALRKHISHFKFVRFHNTSEASLAKFRVSDEKCVLVTTILSASEGTNFEIADSAIYIDFGELVIERARQCFGRVRRRNNPNPVVQNYIFYNEFNAVSYIRTQLNLYHALDLRLTILRKPDGCLHRIHKFLEKEGVDIYKLPKPEFITIFGLNASKDTFLPFKEEEYTYPIFQVMQYMNIAFK